MYVERESEHGSTGGLGLSQVALDDSRQTPAVEPDRQLPLLDDDRRSLTSDDNGEEGSNGGAEDDRGNDDESDDGSSGDDVSKSARHRRWSGQQKRDIRKLEVLDYLLVADDLFCSSWVLYTTILLGFLSKFDRICIV